MRIYFSENDPLDTPVVVLTEPRPNGRSPVLEYAGRIVSEVLEDSSLKDGRFPLLIQHDPIRESYYLLVFSDPEEVVAPPEKGAPLERVLGTLRWKPLERASVEKVVGLQVALKKSRLVPRQGNTYYVPEKAGGEWR